MDNDSTPMLRQYLEIKKEYPDCFLFYRMGDFYELFLEDAVNGAKILDITLTGKSNGKSERIPMAGVPYHAVDNYIAKLIKAGYKVAICEQVSEPDKKGLVEREVTRVITPGTVLDDHILEQNENNYIVSIAMNKNTVAVAKADISTGHFEIIENETEDQYLTIVNTLSLINPSECILSEQLYHDHQLIKSIKINKNCNVYPYSAPGDAVSNVENFFKNEFKSASLDSITNHKGTLGLTTAAALYSYLKYTQKDKLSHFKFLQSSSNNDLMQLDRSTILNLELFTTLRAGERKGSLLSVIDQTQTASGSRMLKNWVRYPLKDLSQINDRLEAVDEFRQNQTKMIKIRDFFRKLTDFERILSRLSTSTGSARDLNSLKNSLIIVCSIKNELTNVSSRLNMLLCEEIDSNLSDIISLINQKILEEPASDLKNGGIIKDGINSELDNLRRKINKGNNWIRELESAERTKTGISSLKIRFNRVFGFYIEISKSNLSSIPDNYIRKQTLVNGERFITAELKKQEEIILNAEEKINQLEFKIYSEVLEEILNNIQIIQQAASAVARLDCLTNFAHIAISNNYSRPQFNTLGALTISLGRHPVVEKNIEGAFVANSVHLDNAENQLLLITGPNMAGKSVFMRQVALIQLLAQIGSFIPAQSANLTICDRIFVRSGASDVISEGLSTFMVEMVETAQILKQATPTSLIIMDEIGRGTSTYDGISIAAAVAEYIVTNPQINSKTLFATHYHELQKLEQQYPSKIKNYHMSVQNENGELVFLHTLSEGGASHSLGVAVAQLAGLPDQVIEAAISKLKQLENQIQHDTQPPPEKNNVLSASILKEPDFEVLEELKSLDIHQITPLQALNILSNIKNKLRIIPTDFLNLSKAD